MAGALGAGVKLGFGAGPYWLANVRRHYSRRDDG